MLSLVPAAITQTRPRRRELRLGEALHLRLDELDVLDHRRGRHVARVDPRVHPDQGDRAVIDEAADLLESGPHRLRSRRTSPGRGGPGRGDGPRSGAYVWSGVRTIRWTAWDPCDRNRCHAVVGTPELAKVLRTRTPMATRRTAFRRTIVHVPGLAIPPTPGARKEMTHVREELQVQITVAQERILAAIEADDPYEVARHRARLQDLVDMAARHGIDVHAWVDQTLLPGGQPAGPDQHV